ncbi:MAG: adenylate/guanylate cyclase domain-containing protein [Bacteroidota bacterium]
MNHKKRKLRAILFADIVGYTALMQRDEQSASNLLRHFQQQLEEKIVEYHGQIVNFYGDGALCTFQIPIDAVRCAIALQSIFQNDPIVPVRIGIHSDTVTYEGDKIFGDSVNITSRIESMGVAGGVLLSKKVRDEVKNNPDLEMQSLGSFEFKNVEEAMEVFALANDGFIVPKKSEMRGKVKSSTPTKTKSSNYLHWIVLSILVSILVGVLFFFNQSQKHHTTLTDKENIEQMEKSIAVLPFRDLSPEGNQVYFADGIVEAIRSKLAQVGNLKVTSMTSVLGYRDNPKPIGVIAKELQVEHILEGTVYRADNKVRVIAQLINAQTDEHL